MTSSGLCGPFGERTLHYKGHWGGRHVRVYIFLLFYAAIEYRIKKDFKGDVRLGTELDRKS